MMAALMVLPCAVRCLCLGRPHVQAGHSAFCLACYNGHTDLVRWFIEDYEHEVAKEFVPMLFECVAAGFVDVVTELLTTGVDALLVDRVCSNPCASIDPFTAVVKAALC